MLNYTPKNQLLENEQLLLVTKNLFKQLETAGESFQPKEFIFKMFQIFPQFAEREDHDRGFKQQDADEFFQLFLATVGPLLNGEDNKNLVQNLFDMKLEVQFQNQEDLEEKSEVRTEFNNKIPCIIDNQQNPVNSLSDGIKVGLEEEVEKYSETLQKNTVWKKISKLASLPEYLIVQKIRFVWREMDTGTNTQAGKAKILRNVSFPKVLDMFDFCTEEL